ncbi:MAG: hypothetical protein ACOX6N_01325 [Patescibacteria group bacterium]|jgi:ActR/RegA family two-component response regulator
MTENERKFVIIEDDLGWQGTLKRFITRNGYMVVGSVSTLRDALEIIPRFGEMGVTDVTVDGNLDEYRRGSDGTEIIKQLEAVSPEIRIIKIAGENFYDDTHPFVDKSDRNVAALLLEAISRMD